MHDDVVSKEKVRRFEGDRERGVELGELGISRRGEGVDDVAIVDVSGAVVSSWGEFGRPVLPRSAAKPLQALPLVTSGAADAFGLGNVELALACGSHDGEPLHVTAVEQWLHRINLTVDALACGVQRPLHDAFAVFARKGARAVPLRHHDA